MLGTLVKVDGRAAQRRVLVCDDHEDSRHLLARIVRSRGYEVIEAANGQEAIDAMMRGDVGCGLLDIELPDIDGFEIARRVRAAALPIRPRLVAVTCHYSSRDLATSREVGFDLHLAKPISIDRIVVALASMHMATDLSR